MKKTVFILFLFIFSCGTVHKKKMFRDDFIFSVKLDTTNFTENIPFIDDNNSIIIPVQIQGKTYNFLFDTGAITILSDSLANQLEVSDVHSDVKNILEDASGRKRNTDFAILPQMSLGTVDFSNIGFSTQDLSKFKNRCLQIDGIIGTNVMRTCLWKIDYKNRLITLSDKKESIGIKNPSVKIPFREGFSGSPQSRMAFGNYGFWATWDTGNNSVIQIPDTLFFANGQQNKARLLSGEGLISETLFQKGQRTVKKQCAVIDSLYFQGKLLLKNQFVVLTPSPFPLLGNGFIKQSQEVLFDWENHTIILKKKPTMHTFKSFGFTPFRTGDAVTVVSLWDKSKAKKRGLELGDTLVSINGQNIGNLDLASWCQKFSALEKTSKIKVAIKKGNDTLTYSFKKHPLFGSAPFESSNR